MNLLFSRFGQRHSPSQSTSQSTPVDPKTQPRTSDPAYCQPELQGPQLLSWLRSPLLGSEQAGKPRRLALSEPSEQLQAHFFKLPFELKEEIFRYLIPSHEVFHLRQSHGGLSRVQSFDRPWKSPDFKENMPPRMNILAIILSCKRMYYDASVMLYSANAFSFFYRATLVHFCQTVSPPLLSSIRSLRLDLSLYDTAFGGQPLCAILNGICNLRELHLRIRRPWKHPEAWGKIVHSLTSTRIAPHVFLYLLENSNADEDDEDDAADKADEYVYDGIIPLVSWTRLVQADGDSITIKAFDEFPNGPLYFTSNPAPATIKRFPRPTPGAKKREIN